MKWKSVPLHHINLICSLIAHEGILLRMIMFMPSRSKATRRRLLSNQLRLTTLATASVLFDERSVLNAFTENYS